MSRRIQIACAISAFAFCLLCASSAASAAASAAKASSAAGCAGARTVIANEAGRAQAVQATLCLVNGERARRGAGPVRSSSPLGSSALGHSTNMVNAGFFSHTSSNGDSLRRRAVRAGYIRRSRSTLVGETIAWGAGTYATPAQLVASFMQSRLHRDTLLDRRYRDVGIGMTRGAPMDGDYGPAATLTLNFGRR